MLSVASFFWLWWTTNMLSAHLAGATIAFYVLVYTLLLKRRTSQNVVWGGAAGCMPVMIGWSAVTGTIGWPALVMFAIIFFWTPPHTWALAMRYKEDYRAAGVPMLPAVATERQVTKQILIYTWLTVLATLALALATGLAVRLGGVGRGHLVPGDGPPVVCRGAPRRAGQAAATVPAVEQLSGRRVLRAGCRLGAGSADAARSLAAAAVPSAYVRCPGQPRQLRPRRERSLLRQHRGGRRLRQVLLPSRTNPHRSPTRDPGQPRHSYSAAVFDLDAGPVTVTLPDAGGRFMSMQVIDEDHYTHDVIYTQGRHTITRERIGTRYVAVPVRILVDPNDPDDMAAVHKLQDGIAVEQDKPGSFEVPHWDPLSQKTVRDALVTLATTLPDTKRTFGTKEDTDPVRHLIGSANAWGGNPEKMRCISPRPTQNDGRTVHTLTVGDVPVDGFWSVTVYNKDGYFSPNPQNAYSFNNVTAQKGRRRKHHHPVRRLRRQRAQLSADHAGLELHRAAVPAAATAPRWFVDLPAGPAGLGNQHDGADGLAALQVSMSALGILEAISLADRHINGSGGDRVEQFSCPPREFIGTAGVVRQVGPRQKD